MTTEKCLASLFLHENDSKIQLGVSAEWSTSEKALKNDQIGCEVMGSSYWRTKIYTFYCCNGKHLPISMQNTVNMDEVTVSLWGRCFRCSVRYSILN